MLRMRSIRAGHLGQIRSIKECCHRHFSSTTRTPRSRKSQSKQSNKPSTSQSSDQHVPDARINDYQRFAWMNLTTLPPSLKHYDVRELSPSSVKLIHMKPKTQHQSLRSALQPMNVSNEMLDYAIYQARRCFTVLSSLAFQSTLSDSDISRIPNEVEALRSITDRFDLNVDNRVYESIIELCNRSGMFELIVGLYQEVFIDKLNRCHMQTQLIILHAITRLSDVESYASLVHDVVSSLKSLDIVTYYSTISALMEHTRSRSRISNAQLWQAVKDNKYFAVSRAHIDSQNISTVNIDITRSITSPIHMYAALFLSLIQAGQSKPSRIRLMSPLAVTTITTHEAINQNTKHKSTLEEVHAILRHFVPKSAVITLSDPEASPALVVQFHPSFTFVAPRPSFLPLSQYQLTQWVNDYRFEWTDMLRKWEIEHEIEEPEAPVVPSAIDSHVSNTSIPDLHVADHIPFESHAFDQTATQPIESTPQPVESTSQPVDRSFVEPIDIHSDAAHPDEEPAFSRDSIHFMMNEELNTITPGKQLTARSFNALKNLASTIGSVFPECSVAAHGSFATGLAVKGSDIDVVVFVRPGRRSSRHSSKSPSPLTRLDEVDLAKYADVSSAETRAMFAPLLRELRRQPHYHNVQMIPARVPIIKLFDRRHSQHFDICFNQVDSVNGFQFINEMQLRHGEEFNQIVLSMKQFLKSRDMHEKFTGGLSSFALSCLVGFHLNQKTSTNFHKHRSNNQPINQTNNRSFSFVESLRGFLSYYGLELDHQNKSLCLARGVMKRRRGHQTLSFIHPFNRALDLGDGTDFMPLKRQFALYARSFKAIATAEQGGQHVDCEKFVNQFFYNEMENDWSNEQFNQSNNFQFDDVEDETHHQTIDHSNNQSIDQSIDRSNYQPHSRSARPLPRRARLVEWPEDAAMHTLVNNQTIKLT